MTDRRMCIDLDVTDLPLIYCDREGRVLRLSEPARELLEGLAVDEGGPMPPALARQVSSTAVGSATVWHPERTERALGCSRYRATEDHDVVLLREVSKKHAELNRALHKQRLESMGRLAATIAHDLRTCVASIIYNLDVLATPAARRRDDLVDETLNEVRLASERLQRTIEGLLEFARAGRPSSTMVSLESVFLRIAAWLRPVISEGGHRFEFPTGSLPVVVGHQITIEQILTNLVLNALEVGEAPASVRLEVGETSPSTIEVRVVDGGPGMPPEIVARVFEPFFTTKENGSGLGLPSAREAARKIGGDVYVVSAEPGTTMGVSLRRAGSTAN